MDELKDLKRIFPEVPYKMESGEVVSISPVPFGKLAVFGEVLASLFGKLQAAGVSLTEFDVRDIGRVFGIAFEEVIALMALILNKPRDWFDTITLVDGIGLLTIIIRQNFNEDAKKKLADLLQKIPSIST